MGDAASCMARVSARRAQANSHGVVPQSFSLIDTQIMLIGQSFRFYRGSVDTSVPHVADLRAPVIAVSGVPARSRSSASTCDFSVVTRADFSRG